MLHLSPDAEEIVRRIMPELEVMFRKWSQEYRQERDLGALGEFVGLYRKARKLKTVFKDGVDPRDWREPLRTIAMEVAAHAMLLVLDIDHGDLCPDECKTGHMHNEDCFVPIDADKGPIVLLEGDSPEVGYFDKDDPEEQF